MGRQGATGDSISEWLLTHPGTVLYIAIMVTASLALQIVLVFFR